MLDHVTVLIGIAHKNRPVGGVIHQPYYNYKNDKAGLGRTMWGIPGIGVGGFKPLPGLKTGRNFESWRSWL